MSNFDINDKTAVFHPTNDQHVDDLVRACRNSWLELYKPWEWRGSEDEERYEARFMH